MRLKAGSVAIVLCVALVLAGPGLGAAYALDVRDIPLPEELGAAARIYRQTVELDGSHVVKTLLVLPDTPRWVLSTRQGLRHSRAIANHYNPLSLWAVLHRRGMPGFTDSVFAPLARRAGFSLLDLIRLETGADMDTMAVAVEKYDGLTVAVLATAGTGFNAMRAGTDYGDWLDGKQVPRKLGPRAHEAPSERALEPGTINAIVLTNASLGDAQMARCIVTVTEAKTAVLEDLEIPSSFTPGVGATGTGTDEVVIVSGRGRYVSCAGGHCKLAQLVAWAAKKAVEQALVRNIRLYYDDYQGRPPKPVPEPVLRHHLFHDPFTFPPYRPLAEEEAP